MLLLLFKYFTYLLAPMMYIQDLREVFLDFNLDAFIDIHDALKETYENEGFMNDSTSVEFVKNIMECIHLNESINISVYDNSSDDENETVKKY